MTPWTVTASPRGERKVDAEFFAGWVALTKLNDPGPRRPPFRGPAPVVLDPDHPGPRPLLAGSRRRGAGRHAPGPRAGISSGAQHIQTFYGQLAAEKAGQTTLTLPGDPAPTQAEVAAFEGNEVVRATRILGETGETSLLRVFAYQLDDDLPSPSDLALLMDLIARLWRRFRRHDGRPRRQPARLPDARAHVSRSASRRRSPGAAPLEFTLAITRQESSFDPRARSGADARGMMQFLTGDRPRRRPPAWACPIRRSGCGIADYNMTLGSYHLAELTNNFGGSMLLTTVGYNAGPARPPQWTARCGDPRGGSGRSGRLHRMCALHRDAQLHDAGDGEHGGLQGPPERRLGPPDDDLQDIARGTPPGPRALSALTPRLRSSRAARRRVDPVAGCMPKVSARRSGRQRLTVGASSATILPRSMTTTRSA